MLRSMTGFGRYKTETMYGLQQWEIKSVNGKHLEIKWKLPPMLRHLEAEFDKIAKKQMLRGRVEISLMFDFSPNSFPTARLNQALASAMLKALENFSMERGDSFSPDYTRLIEIPSLWNEPQLELDNGFKEELTNGLQMALADWNEFRLSEGATLGADLQNRICQLEEWTKTIEALAPQIKEERFLAFRARVQEALAGLELDEQRFIQETVILADKLDVTEEIIRLGTHLKRMHELLQNGKDAGRRLDFTLQECFREINTCGNKLLDSQVSRIVGDYKNELEKCREQAMNLE